jgi:hypothetical protein
MEVQLGESLKGLLLDGLRHHFQYTDEFPGIVEKIRPSGSYEQAPSMGIVVASSGGDFIRNEASNFYGYQSSKTILCAVNEKPSITIDYVIRDHNSDLAPPGAYFVHVTTYNRDHNVGFYTITPYLSMPKERHVLDVNDQFTLSEIPFNNTVRVFLLNGVDKVFVPSEYWTQDTTDERLFTVDTEYIDADLQYLEVDYLHLGETSQPVPFTSDSLQYTIPGVGFKIGKRSVSGDQQIVMVYDSPIPAYQVFGGFADLSFEITVFARDSETRTRIATAVSLYVHSMFRTNLTKLGLQLNEVSIGGEEEDSYDDIAGDSLYTSSISLSCVGYWKQYIPNDVMYYAAIGKSTYTISPSEVNAKIQQYSPFLLLKDKKII